MSHYKLTNPAHGWHLTIIHVPEDVPFQRGQEEMGHPIRCRVTGEAVFGPEGAPVRVALIERSGELLGLREGVEAQLVMTGIDWSRKWGFNPHVTLGEGQSLPRGAVFTHAGWSEGVCSHAGD